MRILSQGEGGLVVELGDRLDPGLVARVQALARLAAARLGAEVEEIVPGYRSLLVLHDPLAVPRAGLVRRLEALAAEAERAPAPLPGRTVRIPVRYGGADGPDLEEVARRAGLSPAEVVRRHAAVPYPVCFLGFTPGFPYLSGLDPRLATPRLDSPRARIPAGSVAIGGEQTGVYPVESPGGWRLIGRTALRLFDPDREDPFLLAAGDEVLFLPVEEAGPAGAEPAAPGPRPGERGGEEASAPAALAVLRPGLLTTVQDLGRPGHRASGMPAAGAMDRLALAAANLLAGNEPGAAALELTLVGGAYRFERETLAALAGADLQARLDGRPVAPGTAFRARPGAELVLGAAARGVRAYLALHGGVDVPLRLGSRSTYARARFGGHEGRALRAGDRLSARPSPREPPPPRVLREGLLPPLPAPGSTLALRLLAGPQDDHVHAEGLDTFFGTPWMVTPQNDRMGYRLDGPAVRLRGAADLLTDPLLPGAVQVPGSGQPIAMAADAQTTGGYPKVGAVIGPDLRALGQARAGDRVRFVRTTQGEAEAALADERARLAALARELA